MARRIGRSSKAQGTASILTSCLLLIVPFNRLVADGHPHKTGHEVGSQLLFAGGDTPFRMDHNNIIRASSIKRSTFWLFTASIQSSGSP